MAQLQPARLPQSPPQRLVNTVWPYVQGKRGLTLFVVAIGVVVVAVNWSWLVAVGVAPLLLAALPCVAMCALGLCMNKAWGKSCSSETELPLDKLDTKHGPGGSAKRWPQTQQARTSDQEQKRRAKHIERQVNAFV